MSWVLGVLLAIGVSLFPALSVGRVRECVYIHIFDYRHTSEIFQV